MIALHGITQSIKRGGIVTNGLVLHLDAGNAASYPGSGTTWTDLSGNAYNGTLTNGPTFDTNSIVLDGSNDYIEFGDVLDIGTNSFTIITWLYITGHNFYTLLNKSIAATANYRYGTFIGGDNNQKLQGFIVGDSGGIDVYGSTNVPTNTWFMASFVFNRQSNLKIYYNINEETLSGSSTLSQWDGLNFQSNNPTRFGAYTASDNVGTLLHYNGKIGAAYFYNKALSTLEIEQNFNALKDRYGL